MQINKELLGQGVPLEDRGADASDSILAGASPLAQPENGKVGENAQGMKASDSPKHVFGFLPAVYEVMEERQRLLMDLSTVDTALEECLIKFATLSKLSKSDRDHTQDKILLSAVIDNFLAEKIAYGGYGPGAKLPVTLFRITKHVDAFDMLVFCHRVKIDCASSDNNTLKSIWKNCPDHEAQPDVLSEAIEELNSRVDRFRFDRNGDPFRFFVNHNPQWTLQDKFKAYQVLLALPKKYSDQVRHLPIHQINHQLYSRLLHGATQKQKAFSQLQEVRDKIITHLPDSLKTNLYLNPDIAYRFLPNSKKLSISLEELIDQQKGKIEKKINNKLARLNNPLTVFQNRCEGIYELLAAINELEQYGKEFVKFEPSDGLHQFNDIDCPKETALKIKLRSGDTKHYHANRVTLPGLENFDLIAAQQPDGTVNGKRNFCKMLDQHADVVVDLRNSRDLMNGQFDYLPSSRKVNYADMGVEKVEETTMSNGVKAVKVNLHDSARSEAKQLEVLQYRDWPDHGVVEPAELRGLRNLLLEAAEKGSVAVHCRAGVGRTGTLLAYTSLYQQLCNSADAHPVSEQEMNSQVVRTIAKLRKQRGAFAVQTPEQLKLIIDTLRSDLQKRGLYAGRQRGDKMTVDLSLLETNSKPKVISNSNPSVIDKEAFGDVGGASEGEEHLKADEEVKAKALWSDLKQLPTHGDVVNDIPVRYKGVVPPKRSVVVADKLVNGQPQGKTPLHANRMELDGSTFTLAQSPHSMDEVWQHWNAIFDQGSSVVEVISAGKSHKKFGLNFIHDALIGSKANVVIGNYEVVHIDKQRQTTEWGYEEIHYTISVQDTTTLEEKVIPYRLIQADFRNGVLKAHDLNEIVNGSMPLDSKSPIWFSSQCGVGRPSAVICALKIRDAIGAGTLTHMDQLESFMSDLVKEGREARGPYFLRKSEQLVELYRLAESLLSNPAPHNLQEKLRIFPQMAFSDVFNSKKRNLLRDPINWLNTLGKWMDKHEAESEKRLKLKSLQELIEWYNTKLKDV